MRNISRAGFLAKLSELDQQARAFFGAENVNRYVHHEGTDAVVEWAPAQAIPGSVVAEVAATLDQAVKQINGAKVMANVTGASALGEQFRNHLAAVKAQIAQAGVKMDKAMGDLTDTAAQANEMVKAVEAETADLKASLGLHSNNPPA